MNALPRRARIYIAVLTAAAAGLLTALVLHYPISIGTTIAFGLLCLLAEEFPVPLIYGAHYSVSFVITIAALVAAGPSTAALAAAFGGIAVSRSRTRKPRLPRQLFNTAQLAITTGAAGLVYAAMGGPVHRGDGVFHVLLPVLFATAVNFIVNTGLVSIMIMLAEGLPFRSVWRNQYLSLALGHGAFAFLGVLLAILYMQMHWAAVLFLLVPLLVARHAFQTSVRMQGAYDQTVRSLITAIEKKDTYTRGHAERVARLSEMTAREHGLPSDRIKLVRFAALMHDVGKLGVSTRVLQKPGKLTPEEYEHMKLHPIRGHEIVEEIDFLTEAVGAVRHHHERMDGGGYPDGLAGEAIPLLARIIMVSDAFDSMTSTRVYRKAKSFDEAFAELHRCEGTQFDSACLAALERAIARNGWEAFPELELEEDRNAHAAGL
ncbi:MAG: HD-GYP domain-containing protein [Actinomycetota bacterium]|nr:HD-GYP domain-containing protein [Actinomycetota bacterium]